jgi:hypothetical protein
MLKKHNKDRVKTRQEETKENGDKVVTLLWRSHLYAATTSLQQIIDTGNRRRRQTNTLTTAVKFFVLDFKLLNFY